MAANKNLLQKALDFFKREEEEDSVDLTLATQERNELTALRSELTKARALTTQKEIEGKDEDDSFYFKSVVDGPSMFINTQGYKDKPHRLQDPQLRQMSLKNTIVAMIIQTRQNTIASYTKLVKGKNEKGFRINYKKEEEALEKIKEELSAKKGAKQDQETNDNQSQEFNKAEKSNELETPVPTPAPDTSDINVDSKDDDKTDDEFEKFDFELERKAKAKLEKQIKAKRKKVEEFVKNGGSLEGRPFETMKWDFESLLRAWCREKHVFDRVTTERVFDKAGRLHSMLPVDASTIKYASVDLKHFKSFPTATENLDTMYADPQLKYLKEEKDVLQLDDKKLAADQYKFVQVIKGKIERAYTGAEMVLGSMNETADIYYNHYSISELELLIGIVTSHLNSEYYNSSYYSQGFSAKGILHLKANLPRRKLETFRQQWKALISGSKNSFQTPIISGTDDVKWLPLTQSHSDIEFAGWMNYLIKIICGIYCIDPTEIGFGDKNLGDKGASVFSGSDTKQRLDNSKDKGLKPLLTFFAKYINKNFIDLVDPDFELEFTGFSDEDSVEKSVKEVQYYKTVNEVRAENDLPPLPKMDAMILNPVYFQYISQFGDEAKELRDEQQKQQQDMMGQQQYGQDFENSTSFNADQMANDLFNKEDAEKANGKDIKKGSPLKIEYYHIDSK